MTHLLPELLGGALGVFILSLAYDWLLRKIGNSNKYRRMGMSLPMSVLTAAIVYHFNSGVQMLDAIIMYSLSGVLFISVWLVSQKDA